MTSFDEILMQLDNGLVASRLSVPNIIIFKQVPSNISSSIIPNMTSLPQAAKDILVKRDVQCLRYRNQYLKVDTTSGIATYFTFDDCTGDDWLIINE